MKIKSLIFMGTWLIIPVYSYGSMTCPTSNACETSATMGNLDYCSAGHKVSCYYVAGPSAPFNVYDCTACSGNRTLERKLAGDCNNVYTARCICANNCKDVGVTNDTTAGYRYYVECGAACDTAKHYSCASGYYGTAGTTTSGCTKCPSNATCSGGNGSTFVCAKGYYKNGSVCTACVSPATTSGTGKTSISDCYIPAGVEYSDTTGKYAYECNCPYDGTSSCSSSAA